MTYRVVIDRLTDEGGGGYLATVPSLPGCMTDGETRAEAASRIDDAIRAWHFVDRGDAMTIPASR